MTEGDRPRFNEALGLLIMWYGPGQTNEGTVAAYFELLKGLPLDAVLLAIKRIPKKRPEWFPPGGVLLLEAEVAQKELADYTPPETDHLALPEPPPIEDKPYMLESVVLEMVAEARKQQAHGKLPPEGLHKIVETIIGGIG
jgi:hypothetical protein